MEFSRHVIGIDGTWRCCLAVARMKEGDDVGQLGDAHRVVERWHGRRRFFVIGFVGSGSVCGCEAVLRLGDGGDEFAVGFHAADFATEFELHLSRSCGFGHFLTCNRVTVGAIHFLKRPASVRIAAFGKPKTFRHACRTVLA